MKSHTQITQPSKEEVRNYLQRRRAEHAPPPAPERIREQLGWSLLPAGAGQAGSAC
ncbi:MAG: hypothetical protein V4724_00965 [Pseudomonadota bacterium]